MRRVIPFFFFIAAIAVARVEDAALLGEVASSWLDQQHHWAFTQHVKEYDGDKLKQERVERYDPSRGYARRWELVSIDGRKPTADEWESWNKRKNKKSRHSRASIGENLDFTNAKVVEETPELIRYELPLRSNVEWLFPISKVDLVVTISKKGPALEQVQARISEPFRVALGLARVMHIDLDLQMEPPPPLDPADAKPSGTASAVVTKLGDRVEYFWSDFHHVSPSVDFDEAGGKSK
jgi:hypothetical protein